MHMKLDARPAWGRLLNAIEHAKPACHGDSRFIADANDLPHVDRNDMRSICETCPILAQCTAYATIDKPTAGWWPGVQLKQKEAT